MAEETKAPERAASRSRSWAWMLGAMLTVVAFLTWLGLASEPSAIAVVEAEAEEEVLEDGTVVVVVPRDTLALSREPYVGQAIRVPSVEATGMVGPQAFWGELGDQMRQVPFLIRLDTAVIGRGVEVRTGSWYNVTGWVVRMTDSIIEDWAARDVLPDEGARLQAEFADYFLHAVRVRAATPARAEGER